MALSEIKVVKVRDSESRTQALQVIEEVYLREKKWLREPEQEIPLNIEESGKHSWFLALLNKKPAGLIRLTYDPSLEFPPELEVTLEKDVDINKLTVECKLVEIGRFMIRPEFRKNIRVALKLMRAAIKEVVERGYTHFLTDVFEDEPNSPLHFHTKILGFERIGSHLRGELNCSYKRIILTLDILKAYQRLKMRNDKIYKEVTEEIRELLEARLARQV